MKHILIIVILLNISLFSGENPKGYIQYNKAFIKFSDIKTKEDFSPQSDIWTIGYMLKKFTIPYLDIKIDSALEASFLSNTKMDLVEDVKHYGDVQAGIEELYALHFKVPLKIGNNLDLNIYGGVSYGGMTFHIADDTINDNLDTSLSYGLGLEYILPRNVYINVKYMEYFKNLTSLEVGFGIKF